MVLNTLDLFSRNSHLRIHGTSFISLSQWILPNRTVSRNEVPLARRLLLREKPRPALFPYLKIVNPKAPDLNPSQKPTVAHVKAV